jgi:contact-dependent growth inhibition (CDI) system CdiI-like immunity protein
MNSTKRLPFTQWADVHRTERFVCIQPLSGYIMPCRDNELYVKYLPPDATDDALGQALLEMLGRSRFIWPPDEPEFYKWQRYVGCYRKWQKDFMERYGYKTKRAAYKNLDWCRITRSEGKISIKPHKRDRPEYFRDLPPENTVAIPATNDPGVLGTALRLALERCE